MEALKKELQDIEQKIKESQHLLNNNMQGGGPRPDAKFDKKQGKDSNVNGPIYQSYSASGATNASSNDALKKGSIMNLVQASPMRIDRSQLTPENNQFEYEYHSADKNAPGAAIQTSM